MTKANELLRLSPGIYTVGKTLNLSRNGWQKHVRPACAPNDKPASRGEPLTKGSGGRVLDEDGFA